MKAAIVFPFLASAALAQKPSFEIPAPTGPYTIGTTSWHVPDARRTESFANNATDREVQVVAWYPVPAGWKLDSTRRAPYLRGSPVEGRTLAAAMRSAGAFDGLTLVKTHAYLDAPVAGGRHPVLVFSHGYTGLVSAYTSLAEDLASHGYIVLSLGHPYEAVATTLRNGGVATMLDSSGRLRREILAVIGEWGDEDTTMARVKRATSDSERVRITREYVIRLPRTREVIDRWVADTRAVLDSLATLDRASVPGRVAAAMDMNRLGVLGHSMGGVVAGEFCLGDARCRAGMNLDGSPQSGSMIDRTMPRPFTMVYSGREARLGASDAIYRRAASRYYRVDVDSTQHIDFSDMNFFGGPLDRPGAHGPLAPARVAAITREIVREYFDQELNGKPSLFLQGRRAIPGARARP